MAIERILLDPAAEVNPVSTDELAEGTTNKYDTGVPPSDLEELPDGATRKAMMDAEKTKLAGVEDGAKDDQTGAEIKAAYEVEEGAFNPTKDTKLDGIEENAKDDQSGAEIRDAVVAIPDLERKIVLTNPQTGEFKVTAVQVAADGKVAVDKDDVPEA